MKRLCVLMAWIVAALFFSFLVFNPIIKDLKINAKNRNIKTHLKEANLLGKNKNTVIRSLERDFKDESVDILNMDEKNSVVLVFGDVAQSFEFSDGPASWDIWVVLNFDKGNKLVGYEVTETSTHL